MHNTSKYGPLLQATRGCQQHRASSACAKHMVMTVFCKASNSCSVLLTCCNISSLGSALFAVDPGPAWQCISEGAREVARFRKDSGSTPAAPPGTPFSFSDPRGQLLYRCPVTLHYHIVPRIEACVSFELPPVLSSLSLPVRAESPIPPAHWSVIQVLQLAPGHHL